MRRLLNFCLLLVMVAAVGYVLYKAKVIPIGRQSAPTPTPSAAPVVARDTLRISVAHRPEILIANALKRLLEAENRNIEIVPFDPETSWMELAAGELDLVIAPIGEAVTAQARFQAGRFLFVSGLSEGYDVILAKSALSGAPKTLGIAGGHGGELFAIGKFPDSRLVNAIDQAQLQVWLREGAVQAAVLESAGIKGELATSGTRLGATSASLPMPTVVVLSRTMLEEGAANADRIEVLTVALESWTGLVEYLSSQPELLRSTLKKEADELGVNVDTLLKDYRFLTPNQGRDALLNSYDDGLLTQTFDLLVLARTANLTKPDWTEVLNLPAYLSPILPGGAVQVEATASPLGTDSPTPVASASATPDSGSFSFQGMHHFPGTAPPDPWPEPVRKKIAKPLAFAPALTDTLVGVATDKALSAFSLDGKPAFSSADAGPLVGAPLADSQNFYTLREAALNSVNAEGTVLWTFEYQGTASLDPVLTPADVVFCLEASGGAHQVIAVSRATGEVTWQASLPDPPASAPVYAESPQPAVLITDDKGNLHAWQAETGSLLWQSSLGQPTFLAPATLGDALAVNGPDGMVRLISLSDGQQTWESDLGTPLAGSPTLTESLVLVPAKDTYLYALDRANGSIKNKTRLSVPLSSPPVVVDDHVYQCDEQGGVHSLTLPALTLNWSKSLGKSALSGPTFSDTSWSLVGTDGSLLIYPR